MLQFQVVVVCALVSVVYGGVIAPHGALSAQSLVFGAPALGHGIAAPAYAAPAYGLGLGNCHDWKDTVSFNYEEVSRPIQGYVSNDLDQMLSK